MRKAPSFVLNAENASMGNTCSLFQVLREQEGGHLVISAWGGDEEGRPDGDDVLANPEV